MGAYADSISSGGGTNLASYALTAIPQTNTGVYPGGSNPIEGLFLPQVIVPVDRSLRLRCDVPVTGSAVNQNLVVGMFELTSSLVELRRKIATVHEATGADFANIAFFYRVPPGDGVTPRDFGLFFGPGSAGTMTIDVTSAANIYAEFEAEYV